ncbi:MAG: 2Fe-2S iron-sulfur cluster binding domain-containing protein [Nitrospinae bacterium]|nr:2Fe-2S iron-sulfur cluster binding domain-containing protein [Nitrospinota bacterium]
MAERHGIDIDFGCRSGNCGTCCVRLISGEVDYPNGNEFQPEPGSCLTCCTVPKTDLTLDV